MYYRTCKTIGGLKKRKATVCRQVYLSSDEVLALREISEDELLHFSRDKYNALSSLKCKLNREVVKN